MRILQRLSPSLLFLFAFILLLPGNQLRSAVSTCPATGVPNVFNVKDFGAVGNGLTNDQPAFQAAIDAAACIGGGAVYVPTGTYLINAPYLTSSSGKVHLRGDGVNAAVLKINATPTGNLLHFTGDDFNISDLSIDMGNFGAVPFSAVNVAGNYWNISHVNITKLKKSGIVCGNPSMLSTYWRIEDCLISRAALSNACDENNAILVTPSTNVGHHGIIKDNQVINGTITVNGLYNVVEGNTVAGFGCGAGIVGGLGDGEENIISNNIVTGGRGPGSDGLSVKGIENWLANTVISGNVFFDNDGPPINQGGLHATVIGNVCTNNGHNDGRGINATYADAGHNGSYSIFVGNQSFNSDSGAQLYGFQNDPAITHVRQIGNNYNPNLTAQTNVTATDSENNMPGISGQTSWNPGAIPNGAAASLTVNVPNAKLGDFVDATFSQNTQGVRLFGWVGSSTVVMFRMENNTGGTKTISSGTLSWVVRKGFNAVNY